MRSAELCLPQPTACELLKDLVMHEEVRHPLLIGLVGLLKPSMDDQQRSSHATTNTRTSEVDPYFTISHYSAWSP